MIIRIYILFLLFSSCFNPVKNKSKNDFLAYYNTFYMANNFYNEALDLIALNDIENSNKNQNQITINTLLDKAIRNSQIIEKDFYETKYIDDAYFILGMSTFYQNKISSSKYYFERIFNEYSQNEYYTKSIIMLSKLSLKMNDFENFNYFSSKVNENELKKEEKVLYYLTLVDYFDYRENIEKVISNSLLAIESIDIKTQKIPIYNSLLMISEEKDNYEDAISYINEIEKCLDDEKIKDELLDKWINYNTILENYDLIESKLNEYVQSELNEKNKLSISLKLINNYFKSNNLSVADIMLNDLLEKHKDNRSLKSEVSEIYYLLGKIELELYNDFEKSKFFFQESIDISRSSEHGQKSNEKIKIINEFLDIQDLIENYNADSSISKIEVDNNKKDNLNIQMNFDSLNYLSAQILFYDLNLKDSGKQRFDFIINNHSDPNYKYKSMMILDSSAVNNLLISDDINMENQLTKLDTLIDEAWYLLLKSRKKSIDKFKTIYKNYNDEKSLFIIGTIYDEYENNIDSTVFYFDKYLNEYPNGNYSIDVNDRLQEIKDMLDYNISFLNQRIHYNKAMKFFKDNYDSSIYYFDLGMQGRDREIKNISKNFIDILKEYHINDSLKNTNHSNLDSLRVNIASILYKNLDQDSLAILVFKDIINNSENMININNSLASMFIIDGSSKWDSLLYENIQDSNLFKLLIDKAKKNNAFLINNSLDKDILDIEFYNNKYRLFD